MSTTPGHRARIAWWAVAASATLAGGFFVADAAPSTTAGADSIAAIGRGPVTSTSRPVTTQPAASVHDTVTPTLSQSGVPSTVTVDAMVETTTLAATTTTQATATTTSVVLEAPVVTAAEVPVAPAVSEEAAEGLAADQAVTDDETVAAPTNQSSCRNDLPDAVMTITMPDISYTCFVYAGGQSIIDTGAATMITGQYSSFPLAAHPGDAGTLWITGHRVSHGGPFAAVPDLPDGAIITVSDSSRTASYVIVGRSYVEIRDGYAVDASGQATESATSDAVLRPDRNVELAPRLLLQTCDAENFRWMIYADLIEG